VSISHAYLELALAELRLTHEYENRKHQEQEEQRQIRERMRDEERAQREFDKAKAEAEVEEARYQKALERARDEVKEAKGAELDRIQAKVQDLEQKLAEAHAKMERATSMAQLTKSGNVYVLSNIGSFGERVFKIGMTRRIDPIERVQELGDASVPFAFDIHAMIYTEDAPGLENAFHRQFDDRRVNLVNVRKEYFEVSLGEIEAFARSQGLTVQFTKLAEAREYRETLAIREQTKQSVAVPVSAPPAIELPERLFDAKRSLVPA
jgi:predicted RNase H-like nuclease (RuvC/YqgF family)